MSAYRSIKLFDLSAAPEDIRQVVRPVALAHAGRLDAAAIWEVTVGSYDWREAKEEWALHDWMRQNGAVDNEVVLVRMDPA
jgi:hypothetical protein